MRRNEGFYNPQQSSYISPRKASDGRLLRTHFRRQPDYGQSSTSFNRGEINNYQFSTNVYYNRYDGASTSRNFTIPQAPKRQTPNQYWTPATTNRNFTTAPRINPWQTSIPEQNTWHTAPRKFQPRDCWQSHCRNVSNPIRSLMSIRPSISPKIQKRFPPRKDFKPSKVSKPKPHQAPNKRATSNYVAKSVVSKVVDTNVDKKADFRPILRADKTPTVQMKGRLELAICQIVEDIKFEHCTTPGDLEYFNASFVQRLIKHTIRTRIWKVMLDQVVGNISDIVANYRKKYPKNTDIELVQIAKDAKDFSTKTISDDPKDFYKKNVAVTELEEIFQNLDKIFMNKRNDLEECSKNMPEPKNIGNEQNKTEDKGANNADNQKDNTQYVKGDEVVIVEPLCEQFSKTKYYQDLMIDDLLEAIVPKILPKLKDTLQSTMHMDNKFANDTSLTSNSNEITTATKSTTIISSEATSEPTKKSCITLIPIKSEPDNASVIQSKVPAKDKLLASPKTPASSELYYFELISSPALPARAVVYDFLNQFNPNSIQISKSVSNLRVGFKNIEDYNKILAVNESVVGNVTIVIKASENQVSEPKEATPSGSDSNEDVLNTSNQSSFDLIDSDLENQLTELLNAIENEPNNDALP